MQCRGRGVSSRMWVRIPAVTLVSLSNVIRFGVDRIVIWIIEVNM